MVRMKYYIQGTNEIKEENIIRSLTIKSYFWDHLTFESSILLDNPLS